MKYPDDSNARKYLKYVPKQINIDHRDMLNNLRADLAKQGKQLDFATLDAFNKCFNSYFKNFTIDAPGPKEDCTKWDEKELHWIATLGPNDGRYKRWVDGFDKRYDAVKKCVDSKKANGDVTLPNPSLGDSIKPPKGGKK